MNMNLSTDLAYIEIIGGGTSENISPLLKYAASWLQVELLKYAASWLQVELNFLPFG